MKEVNKHIIIALREIGEKEILGELDNPRISEYLATVNMAGDDEIPWCAAFVNWVLKEAGIGGTNRANAKSYLTWGYEINDPILGAICVFHRGSKSWQGHVGISIDETKSYIYILSGNQEDRVSVRPYRKNKLAGIRWNSEFI